MPFRINIRRSRDRGTLNVPYGRHEVRITRLNILEESLVLLNAFPQYLRCFLDKMADKLIIGSERMLPFPQHQAGEELSLEQACKAM